MGRRAERSMTRPGGGPGSGAAWSTTSGYRAHRDHGDGRERCGGSPDGPSHRSTWAPPGGTVTVSPLGRGDLPASGVAARSGVKHATVGADGRDCGPAGWSPSSQDPGASRTVVPERDAGNHSPSRPPLCSRRPRGDVPCGAWRVRWVEGRAAASSPPLNAQEDPGDRRDATAAPRTAHLHRRSSRRRSRHLAIDRLRVAARGELPVLRFGRRLVVTRATLVTLLGIDSARGNHRSGQRTPPPPADPMDTGDRWSIAANTAGLGETTPTFIHGVRIRRLRAARRSAKDQSRCPRVALPPAWTSPSGADTHAAWCRWCSYSTGGW